MTTAIKRRPSSAVYRSIAEAKIGRSLRADEVVHHVDHNPWNNAPENLQVMTATDHLRLHAMQRYVARAAACVVVEQKRYLGIKVKRGTGTRLKRIAAWKSKVLGRRYSVSELIRDAVTRLLDEDEKRAA